MFKRGRGGIISSIALFYVRELVFVFNRFEKMGILIPDAVCGRLSSYWFANNFSQSRNTEEYNFLGYPASVSYLPIWYAPSYIVCVQEAQFLNNFPFSNPHVYDWERILIWSSIKLWFSNRIENPMVLCLWKFVEILQRFDFLAAAKPQTKETTDTQSTILLPKWMV